MQHFLSSPALREPALVPKKELLLPIALSLPAETPKKLLNPPLVSERPAFTPKKELKSPPAKTPFSVENVGGSESGVGDTVTKFTNPGGTIVILNEYACAIEGMEHVALDWMGKVRAGPTNEARRTEGTSESRSGSSIHAAARRHAHEHE